jgi:hypothetical protein
VVFAFIEPTQRKCRRWSHLYPIVPSYLHELLRFCASFDCCLPLSYGINPESMARLEKTGCGKPTRAEIIEKVFLNVGRNPPFPTSAPTIQPPSFPPVPVPSPAGTLLEPPSNYPLSLSVAAPSALLEPPLPELPLVQNAVASSASVFFARSPSVVFVNVLLGLCNNLKINVHLWDSSIA